MLLQFLANPKNEPMRKHKSMRNRYIVITVKKLIFVTLWLERDFAMPLETLQQKVK